MAKPSRAVILSSAGAALAAPALFAPFLPDRFSVQRALCPTGQPGQVDPRALLETACGLRTNYVPATWWTLVAAGVAAWIVDSPWPLFAGAGATAAMIAQYEAALPPELRLDPFRALWSGATRTIPVALLSPARASLHAVGGASRM